MARRDQPYLPLYVDDFLSDEKLSLCSAESTGVYIRLMCLMHKSDEYGVILLKQKFKQTSKQIRNFACLLSKQMPYQDDVIERSLQELIDEGVLILDGDRLIQKRMVKDAKISDSKASNGRKGGKKTQSKNRKQDNNDENFASNFALAKSEANTVNGIVIVNENKDIDQYLSLEETTDAREDFSRVMTFYEEQIGALPSPSAIEMLLAYTEDMGAEVVCKAVEIAVDAGAKNWRYIESVLQNWTKQKVKSLADVQRIEAQRKKKKEAGNGRNTGSAPAPDKPKRSLGGVIEL